MTCNDLAPILDAWPELAGGRATLINLSENHTFRIDCPGGGRFALRVHRPGYQDRRAIESELIWIEALGRDTSLLLPKPVRGANGQYVQRAANRHAVLFFFEQGQEPAVNTDLPATFEILGEIAATCHLHAQKWQRPVGFTRQTWDVPAMLSPRGLWGDWRLGPNLDPAGRAVLEQAVTHLERLFAEYGQDRGKFGLVHADMRLANLLVHEGKVRLIDFDDCGFGWFVYDFAAAISFFETDPMVPALAERWLQGYARLRPLSEGDKAMLPAAILLRRMLLLAWIGSHHEVELARELSPQFAQGTVQLAKTLGVMCSGDA